MEIREEIEEASPSRLAQLLTETTAKMKELEGHVTVCFQEPLNLLEAHRLMTVMTYLRTAQREIRIRLPVQT